MPSKSGDNTSAQITGHETGVLEHLPISFQVLAAFALSGQKGPKMIENEKNSLTITGH